jgi:putative ABC transport system permease protein
MIRPGQRLGAGAGAAGAPTFKESDAEAIQAQSGRRGRGARRPCQRDGGRQRRNWSTSVTGTTNRWFTSATGGSLGPALLDEEETAGSAVCIIGETVRREIYGGTRGLGEQLRIKQFSAQ